MSRSKQPPFEVGTRVRLASWVGSIPSWDGRPFVGHDTVLEVAEVRGRGTKPAPWQVIAAYPGNPDPTIRWYLDPECLEVVEETPNGLAVACTELGMSLSAEERAGFAGLADAAPPRGSTLAKLLADDEGA